jgi:methyltransferase (TIGR00027 family)
MPKRIESKTSRTAEFTCMVRYLSYMEKREQLKSDDYVSPVIMNSLIKLITRFGFVKKLFVKNMPWGMYGYVIARTKFIDKCVKTAMQDGIEQILILGAGFDSRGIRFYDLSQNAKIFELDAYATQKVKIDRYKEKGVGIPENLIFVPIDFDKQSISERLSECGFEKGRPCLFILEGLTMYLQPESADSLFKIMRDLSGGGSRIVFDFIYASVLRNENLYEGEKELVEGALKSGEGFCFGIEKGAVNEFLSGYHFEAEEILDHTELENKYFMDESGKNTTLVNGIHCIVKAQLKNFL